MSHVRRFRKAFKSCIYKVHPSFVKELGTDLAKQEDILDFALIIATSALGSLMVERSKIEDGVGYSPYIHFAIYVERERMVELLMSAGGIEYQRFRRTIYSCILSCLETGDSMDTVLVAEQDGLLLYPKIILGGQEGGKIERTSAFNLILRPGAIRTESSQRYKFIKELLKRDHESTSMTAESGSIKAFFETEYLGLTLNKGTLNTDWMAQPPELLAHTSIQGDSILVRPTLRVFPKNTVSITRASSIGTFNPFTRGQVPRQANSPVDPVELRFRYLDVMENLATALLVPKSPALSILAEAELAKKYRLVLTQTSWLHSASTIRTMTPWISGTGSKSRIWTLPSSYDEDWRFIVYTGDDKGLTLLQLSVRAKSGRTVIVEKGCNLMQAIHAAEKAQEGNWVIVVGGH